MISVTILTKNNARTLPNVLCMLAPFDEVLIYDTGSTDETLAIAEQYRNTVIYKGPLAGFGPTHNRASELAKNEWILSIDSDEVPSSELVDEIQNMQLQAGVVYSIPRCNYYNGKWIRGCGWYPDRVRRLYNKTETRFNDAHVHESILTTNMHEIDLKNPLNHYSYTCLSEFIAKMQAYSDLFAQQCRGKRSSSPCKAALHASYAFIKSYFLQRGIFDGYEGFTISSYNAMTAFYKYLKLYEANKLLKTRRCPEENASLPTEAKGNQPYPSTSLRTPQSKRTGYNVTR